VTLHDFPNLPPSVCFLCEGAEPEGSGVVYVDTFQNFDPGVHTKLNGRKYVCSNCIRDLAGAVGLFDVEKERFAIQLNALEEEIAQLNTTVESYRNLDAAIKALAPVAQTETKKQPRAKKVAQAATTSAE
jgi:hypothetical protein